MLRRLTVPAGAGVLLAVLLAVGGGTAGTTVRSLLAALVVVAAGVRAMQLPPWPRRRPVADPAESGRRQWSALHQLESAVLIGLQSRHHFDATLRPRLHRVLLALAAGRRGSGPRAGTDSPDSLAALVGPDLAPLVDISRPASRDSTPGGVRLADLDRLLTRIEQL